MYLGKTKAWHEKNKAWLLENLLFFEIYIEIFDVFGRFLHGKTILKFS